MLKTWLLGTCVAVAALVPVMSARADTLPAPHLAAAAVDLGPVDPQTPMTLTVLLKHHNEAQLQAAIDQLYDPQSSRFRQWLTVHDLAAYAPTADELATVKNELLNHGLQLVSIDPNRFSVRVRGPAQAVERAFQTTLHTYDYKGKTFIAHTTTAQLTGAAGNLVDTVAGLDRHNVHPMLSVAKDPLTNQPLFKQPYSAALAGDISSQFSDLALGPVTQVSGANHKAGTEAKYTGWQYSPTPNTVVSFLPAQLQSYYGLPTLYNLGYDGKGQTVALIEAYGYDAALTDANTAAQAFNLPLLTSSTFKTVYPEGPPNPSNLADLTGWTGEIALDIQTVHSIAPGAKITVVASNGQDNEAQIASIQYVINHNVAHSISGSWENDIDIESSDVERRAFSSVLELGAAQGFAFQFSSGDSGDGGLGTPNGAPGLPAEVSYATAVGGTSILNNVNSPGQFLPTGWGTSASFLFSRGPIIPPSADAEFVFGGGGGQSLHIAKPKWEIGVTGNFRSTPDVAALADPFTGFVTFTTDAGTQYIQGGIGGTSLASPLFTAIWAIANQYAGKNLGQAAPAIARLAAGEITNVTNQTLLNSNDVSGSYLSGGVTTAVDPADIFGPTYAVPQSAFVSAFYDGAIVLSFGLDSSLTPGQGWNNQTGYGEPNGLPFITAVAKGH